LQQEVVRAIIFLFKQEKKHMSSAVSFTKELLEASYLDATRKNGLIDFTQQVRTDKNDMSGKYSVKQKDLDNLFSASVWKEHEKKGGHRKLTSLVTGVVVEYPNHAKDIEPGSAETVLHAVQKHLNILHNDVFGNKARNWKDAPDYSKILRQVTKSKL
jgi:hypothetical protein